MPEPSKSGRHGLPRHYTPGIVSILKAVVVTIRPASGGFERPDDGAVVRTVLSFVPYMTPGVRWAWPFGLWMLDKMPFCFGFGGRFRSLAIDDRVAFLARLRESFPPFPALVDGMRSLIMLSFYQQPQVLDLLEVDWARRARELVERRARLQELSDDLANPRNVAKPGV
jgi:hypothetical protein